MPEVVRRTGMSSTTVYRRISDGTFPRPVSLGCNRVAWLESEIDAWIFARVEERERDRETEAA
ncbi:helix-turn-helix transcriptional regulator [Paraburkholderia phymatum]